MDSSNEQKKNESRSDCYTLFIGMIIRTESQMQINEENGIVNSTRCSWDYEKRLSKERDILIVSVASTTLDSSYMQCTG